MYSVVKDDGNKRKVKFDITTQLGYIATMWPSRKLS